MRDALKNKKAYGNKGFTLVELIVVLIVLCILSSVAVLSIVGYIDRSRYNKNEQNAQSIYQAAEAAINKYAYTGQQEQWIVNTLIAKGKLSPYIDANAVKTTDGKILDKCFNEIDYNKFTVSINKAGESVHMRYVLTHNKGVAEDELTKLLGEYFYDTSVFDATFSVEFDVEKTIWSDNTLHYTVNVYSVFFDSGRETWDDVAKNSINLLEVPFRDESYREDTSLVGYYNGLYPSAVDSVILPVDEDRIEFSEVTLRNDETLDLTFSAYCGDEQITGAGKYKVHYTASVYDSANNSNEKLADLVISEAALTKGMPSSGKLVDYFTNLRIDDTTSFTDGATETKTIDGISYNVLYTKEVVYDKDGRKLNRYKATIESTALVYVHKGSDAFDYNSLTSGALSASTDFYYFPVAISYVLNEDTAGNQKGYVTYTISLDAMMSREALYKLEQNKTSLTHYKTLSTGIARIFSDTDGMNNTLAPKNIYVSMKAERDNFSDSTLSANNETTEIEPSYSEAATRAYDDPIYLNSDGEYKYNADASTRDKLAGGFAVVNTFYGDLGAGSLGSTDTVGSAVITSFRHLYNMRFTEGFTGDVVYTIRRDLNWYEATSDGRYTSNVRVYGLDSGKTKVDYYSPVGKNAKYSSDITMVLWPALPKVAEKQTLAAGINDISGFTDKTAVIRNVQMRLYSFLSTDTGYGFICENDGTVENLRCENFRLTFDKTYDGDGDDKTKQNSAITDLIKNGNKDKNMDDVRLADNNQAVKIGIAPVGCLIGLNKGRLGSDSTDLNNNMIAMRNCSVMTGGYYGNKWKRFENLQKPTGCVAGDYADGSSSNGLISVTGRYVVVGKFSVGGIFGAAETGIGAYLMVDGDLDREKADMVYSEVGTLVHGRTDVGGAIGYMSNCYLAENVSDPTYSCDSNGVVSVNEATEAKYGIYANLSSDSVICQYIGSNYDNSLGTGGAIGYCENYDYTKKLSIKCLNAGYIYAGENDTTTTQCRNVAGAIGYLNGGSASSIFIKVENSGCIGSKDKTNIYGKNYCTAVGVACINNFGTDGAKYIIDANNSGKLFCYTNKTKENVGTGVAIGASLTSKKPEYYIKAVNSGSVYVNNVIDNQTTDTYWKTGTSCNYGVGGAVGYIYDIGASHIYASIETGGTLECTGNNIGGAVGCIRNSAKGTGTDIASKLTITASLNSGITVRGKALNVGGSVGNMWCQGQYSDIRTIVNGSATVYGYKNVGGVIGREQQEGTVTGASVTLQGSSGSSGKPTLTVKATKEDGNLEFNNQNIGGAIGVLGTHGAAFNTAINMPTQTGDDKLVLNVNAYERIGGMVGTVCFSDLQGASQHYGVSTSSFDVVLDGTSVIKGTNNYVGGGIGFMEDTTSGDFASNLKVTVNSGATATVISGADNIGGAIGYANVTKLSGDISSILNSSESVKGTNYVGGTAGHILISGSTGEFRSELYAEKAVIGSKQIGGCVGAFEGSGTVEHATTILGVWADDAVCSYSPIYGNKEVGGCIGLVNSTSVNEAETAINTTGTIITKNTTSTNENDTKDIGGVVGLIKEQGKVNTVELYGILTNTTNLNFNANNIGGFVGHVDKGTIGKTLCSVPFNVTGVKNVGGVIGFMENSGTLTEFILNKQIDVSGTKYIGGCIGRLDNSVVGGGVKCEITNVHSVISSDRDKTNGTGGMVGYISNGGVINGDVEITLGQGCIISGGYNVGGVVGLMVGGTVKGNAKTIFTGGTVTGTNGGVGGVIGAIMVGNVTGQVTSNIQYVYSFDDPANTPVSGLTDSKQSNGKGIGGVIGSLGADNDKAEWKTITYDGYTYTNDRKSEIFVNAIVLELDEDFKLLSGISGVGGLLGRCETFNGEIDEMKIYSVDGETHDMIVQPRSNAETYDIGGMVGYMLGKVTGPMTMSDVNFKISGRYYIGGIIGGLDGELGKKDNPSTINVKGIKSVVGQNNAIGGLIGCLGAYNNTGVIYSNIIVDLSGAEIKSTGSNDVGGVIGCLGRDTTGKGGGNNSGKIYGNINLTLSGTTITGTNNVGGVIGFTKSDAYINEESVFSVTINSDSEIKSKNSGGNAGGVVGINKAVFLADYSLDIADGKTYTITTNNGYSGGIMGQNENVFGKTGSHSYTIPTGVGTLSLVTTSDGKVGLILGQNTSAGICGVVVKNGSSYEIAGDGNINYIPTVDMSGKPTDTTAERVGYVGNNSGTIERVTIADENNSGNNGQNNDQNDVQNDDQNDVQNDDQNNVQNDDQNDVQNDDQNNVQNDDQNNVQNDDQNDVQNDDQNNVQNDDQNNVQNDDQNDVQNNDQNDVQNNDQNDVQNNDQNDSNNPDNP